MKASSCMAIATILTALVLLAIGVAVAEGSSVSSDQVPSDKGGDIPQPKSYMYVLTTDNENNRITRVQVSENGSALSMMTAMLTGSEGISSFWNFDKDTGMGPFNSFYAAINIEAGPEADNGEKLLNTAAGTVAFVLDPYNLSRTIKGTEFTGDYNVMLIVPAVYWKADGNDLYLSSSPSYSAGGSIVGGMVAYAHTATSGGSESVFPYLGIGVYEASVSDGKMVSVSGAVPQANTNYEGFRSFADALAPAEGSDYQMWNFWQWTLCKMMAYTVMGSKDSQATLGAGPVSGGGPSASGLADLAGPYGATESYSKLFIENSWGSLLEFVGDAYFDGRVLHAGNTFGGAALGQGQEAYPGAVLPRSGWITGAYSDSAFWDLPMSAGGDASQIGDLVWGIAGQRSLCVGGSWADGSGAGVAYAYAIFGLSYSDTGIGARLAYLMAADAVGPIETAPVPEPANYLYSLETDASNAAITKVSASEGGSEMTQISGQTAAGAGISDFWEFDRDTGMGPFNSFYAAVNISDGGDSDGRERKLSGKAGEIAFVLDPYDLSRTLRDTVFSTENYNIMLIVPAVYWKADGNVLYLSSSPSYSAGGFRVSGMAAYAHTATSGGSESVFPYLGIGVYEASVHEGKMLSVSGAVPQASTNYEGFRSFADALAPAEGSDYQMWNFWQWTLCKMMAYTVMGSKDSQATLGAGPVSGGTPSASGLADLAGPYGATESYSKLFIENSWGSLLEFVGDAYFDGRVLHAGNTFGGAALGQGQEAYPGAVLPSSGWITGAYSDSAFWDLPMSAGGDASQIGDRVWGGAGQRSLYVGGGWAYGSYSGIAYTSAYNGLGASYQDLGTRLAYLMSADAVPGAKVPSVGLRSFAAAVSDTAPGDAVDDAALVPVGFEEGYEFSAGGIVYSVVDPIGMAVKAVGYESAPVGALTVPGSVSYGGFDYSVAAVAKSAFSGCKGITSVVLGANTELHAFYKCSGIKSLTVCEGAETIGVSAFAYCSGLEHVEIASSVSKIGGNAFYQTAFHVASGAKVKNTAANLAGKVFEGGSKELWEVFGVGGLKYTSAGASAGSVRLVGYFVKPVGELVVPPSVYYGGSEYRVECVAKSAFSGCKGITSVVLGANTELHAFYKCSGIKSLTVCEGVETIGVSAFAYCSGLEHVEIASSVSKIGGNAFYQFAFHGASGAKVKNTAANLAGKVFEGGSKSLFLVS